MGSRERFYKRILLDVNSIAPNPDKWKNLTVQNVDGNDISNKLEFPTTLTTVVIVLDNEKHGIEFSFNGKNLDGELFSDDGALSQDCTHDSFIHFRLPEGTDLKNGETIQVRVWGWRGGAGL